MDLDPAIDQEDLQQDAFLAVHENKLSTAQVDAFCCRRRIDIARRRGALRRRGPVWWRRRALPVGPLESALTAERDANVDAVVRRLPTRPGRVASLLSAGLGQAAIARRLHVSGATVCRDVRT